MSNTNPKTEAVPSLQSENPCRSIRLEKVVVNIGVGSSGERLEKAKNVLKKITDATPSERKAVDTIREFNVTKNDPIAVMATLRRKRAETFLRTALKAVGNKLQASSFSGRTFSFGIKEHITIPGIRYDPAVGVYGMDVCVVLERPGYRVTRRRRKRSKIGKGHEISTEESIGFVKTAFEVEVS
jgi:large subunit ribosomal protein L5